MDKIDGRTGPVVFCLGLIRPIKTRDRERTIKSGCAKEKEIEAISVKLDHDSNSIGNVIPLNLV